MRYDMAGGAAVLGAMRAIAQIKPSIPVTALVPTVENMPGSKAQRPGDIVKSLSGKTVEVLNTDAEGRLILIDALTYAQRLGCTHLVDAATLTGAIVVALGSVNVGAFTNNEAFLAKLLAAAKAEGEKTWQMPMDEEYKELLKSNSPICTTSADAPAGPSPRPGSFAISWTKRRGFTWTSLALPGWTMPSRTWRKAPPAWVCGRSCAWPKPGSCPVLELDPAAEQDPSRPARDFRLDASLHSVAAIVP